MNNQKYNLLNRDVLDFCRDYDGEKFHACLCDPPYHLTSLSRNERSVNPANKGQTVSPFGTQSKGFMGKEWDGGDIAFRPETWAAIASVLYPGAFLFAFAGTRGYHRMACAIEDAGFIIHPAIAWINGQGFPKAQRIKTGEYEATGETRRGAGSAGSVMQTGPMPQYSHSLPLSELAKAWAGHRYGGQVLKPCVEFVCVAQKPYSGKPVDCITKTGAGAINIGAGRIGSEATITRNTPGVNKFAHKYSGERVPRCGDYENPAGRWPSNVILSAGECADAIDAQSGVSVSSGGIGRHEASIGYGGSDVAFETRNYASKGEGASRFYHQTDWNAEVAEGIAEAFPARYVAKAGRTERDAGLEAMPVQESDSPLVMNPGRDRTNPNNAIGTGAKKRIERGDTPIILRVNNHPCQKPIRLTRYLASLLLPPAEYAPRRLFVPFAGAGSEVCGAILAGWEEIVGVEQSEEYVTISRARAKFWSMNCSLFESLTESDEPEPEPAQQGMTFEEGEE